MLIKSIFYQGLYNNIRTDIINYILLNKHVSPLLINK